MLNIEQMPSVDTDDRLAEVLRTSTGETALTDDAGELLAVAVTPEAYRWYRERLYDWAASRGINDPAETERRAERALEPGGSLSTAEVVARVEQLARRHGAVKGAA